MTTIRREGVIIAHVVRHVGCILNDLKPDFSWYSGWHSSVNQPYKDGLEKYKSWVFERKVCFKQYLLSHLIPLFYWELLQFPTADGMRDIRNDDICLSVPHLFITIQV